MFFPEVGASFAVQPMSRREELGRLAVPLLLSLFLFVWLLLLYDFLAGGTCCRHILFTWNAVVKLL